MEETQKGNGEGVRSKDSDERDEEMFLLHEMNETDERERRMLKAARVSGQRKRKKGKSEGKWVSFQMRWIEKRKK